uniref:Non-selective voltage-gated ion channel VDAC2 n=1 Tax=Cyprinodon variegatus TaxID=28743 RepID=A0A3Q2FYY3_CYPVA
MAVPPTYADLGKSAKDIFNKGYGFGLVKLDVKTKSASGVEFKTSGSSNTDTSKVAGSLETKYKRPEYGLTFTEKWNTDNTLGTEIWYLMCESWEMSIACRTVCHENRG